MLQYPFKVDMAWRAVGVDELWVSSRPVLWTHMLVVVMVVSSIVPGWCVVLFGPCASPHQSSNEEEEDDDEGRTTQHNQDEFHDGLTATTALLWIALSDNDDGAITVPLYQHFPLGIVVPPAAVVTVCVLHPKLGQPKCELTVPLDLLVLV